MDTVQIGKFLKTLRKEKAMTQEELSQVLNVSSKTVSRWETGVNLPDLDMLIILSQYYGVDIQELLNGERKAAEAQAPKPISLGRALSEYQKQKESPQLRALHRSRQEMLRACFWLCFTLFSFSLFYISCELGAISTRPAPHFSNILFFAFPLTYLVFLLYSYHFLREWQYIEPKACKKMMVGILCVSYLWGFILWAANFVDRFLGDSFDLYVYPLVTMALSTAVAVLYFFCARNIKEENELIDWK